ncbi:MAG TPA: methyltransferase domain-containing protein [Acidimicrobiales bacterium]|nr:methyltransferase domain-containing protein [Acidimicrobiales bacterium]
MEASVRADALVEALLASMTASGSLRSPRVADAFRAVRRHTFVPGVGLEQAYRDEVVPVKMLDGRLVSSCSQPSIVACMLEQLELAPGMRVLEVGAGTGWNAALLGWLVGPTGSVVTIDIDDDLVTAAQAHLAAAGSDNVLVVSGDGRKGFAAGAPFDRIVLTVGASDLAGPWWDQLQTGGRMVLPLSLRGIQRSIAFDEREGMLASTSIHDCAFMRLRGGPEGDGEQVVTCGPLTVTIDRAIDASSLRGLISRPAEVTSLALPASAEECFGGIALWLALHDPDYCGIDIDWAPADGAPIMMAAEFRSGRRILGWSPALYSGEALALLGREGRGLVINTYGGAADLVDRLVARLGEWHLSGRPNSSSLVVHGYRRPALPPPSDSAILLERDTTTFAIHWPADAQ